MSQHPHIGAALRYVRHTLRLKIEMVAQDARCTPSNLSRIENGRQNPSIPLLQNLATALQTPVSRLFSLIEAPPASLDPALPDTTTLGDREWLELRQRLEMLSPTRREQAMQTLYFLYHEQLQEQHSQGANTPVRDANAIHEALASARRQVA